MLEYSESMHLSSGAMLFPSSLPPSPYSSNVPENEGKEEKATATRSLESHPPTIESISLQQ
jgi:hypothetical protein